MNNNIDVNVQALDNAINQLNRLKQINSLRRKVPTTQGGGKVVNEIERLAKEFDQVHMDMVKMINSTQLFLVKARNAYVSADTKSASGIQEK